MKHLIIISDKEKAKNYIRKVLTDVHPLDISHYIENVDQILVKTVTEEYEWVRGNQFYQGKNADVIHIESGVDINMLYEFYFPMVANSTAPQKVFYVDVISKTNIIQDKVGAVLDRYTLPQHIKTEALLALNNIDNLMIQYFSEKFTFVPEFIAEQTTPVEIVEETTVDDSIGVQETV